MGDFVKKALVCLISGGIAFYFAFNWAREIRVEAEPYGGGTDGIEMAQCVNQFSDRLPSKVAAETACRCTRAEFKRRGLELTDMITGDRAEMQEIADACIAMAS
ncbi:hypothetical protein [Croceicoccus naphthovorans]|uniref:Uncharacterized protein n=1 Tax=Croceicoccus naphthovorans TaxID=1348774 RepID=A0A0G3XG77_9SPHN|nr:hypothetical protein [Croceicoccus naphthovorans]AKM09631.1 hypothetical protein AB433_05975 [Croceicoccus naphthovorans]MBB3989590.1 hypothetical protein [Croceicoccus naphthovorans]